MVLKSGAERRREETTDALFSPGLHLCKRMHVPINNNYKKKKQKSLSPIQRTLISLLRHLLGRMTEILNVFFILVFFTSKIA